MLSAKQIIQVSVDKVANYRQRADVSADLKGAVSIVKNLQSTRFMGTYTDLLKTPLYQPATQFFLEELYSEKDYTQRDAQFARIAGTLERMFPKQVVQTAVSLAELHCLTEELDLEMAQIWLNLPQVTDDFERYHKAWNAIGRRADRQAQLSGALRVGQELVTLTRTPGLRLALKMMRKPAQLAGLADLQHFLESGFDTFAGMKTGAEYFLETVQKREAAFINMLFEESAQSCKATLKYTEK